MIDRSELPVYCQAIELAAEQGYSADPSTGIFCGKSGATLQIKKYPGAAYPGIRLHIKGLPKKAYSVSAHKFMAYIIWGRQALLPGVVVRHGANGLEDLRHTNLKLGSYSDNELDKPKSVRVAVAKVARAAQGHVPFNAKLTLTTSKEIKNILSKIPRTPKGLIPKGTVKSLAIKYNVSPSTVSLIGKGKTWNI